MARTHIEQYLYLADLTHESALIAWGGFHFRQHDDEPGWELVDDERLQAREETIGERSEPYGDARVCVYDERGRVVSEARTSARNHVLVSGLEPGRRYRYAVFVDGEEWAAGERNDWIFDPSSGHEHLCRSGRRYDNTFQTFPDPKASADLSFVLIGDYGVGIRGHSDSARRQREVAAALERAVHQHDVRFLVTAGDNIYLPKQASAEGLPKQESDQGSGDEDDDWFFTFYQPYRYIINRIPVYPTVGNHDSDETEQSDDREQLEDNFFLRTRFSHPEGKRSSEGPGLYYRFKFGRDIELVSIDTSQASSEDRDYYFELPAHREFLEETFSPRSRRHTDARWVIPFAHHPPYCAGPRHGNNEAMIRDLVPLFRAAGVRAMFAGHEHNFQYALHDDIHYFVSGAAAKLRPEPPTRFEAAHTQAWAAEQHFLLVRIRGDEMRVTPIARSRGDELIMLRPTSVRGEVALPIVIRR